MKRKSQKKTKELQQQLLYKPEFDNDKLFSYQRKLQILYESALQKNKVQSFLKLKFRQNIFQIGEILQLYEPTEKSPYVVRLQGIYRFTDGQQMVFALKVQWLLRKTEIPQKYIKYQEHFSIAEVFPSNQFDFVPIESIMRKSSVINFEEYEHLEKAGDNIYFSRAVYDTQKQLLIPHPSQWVKECYCQMPINPDLTYTQCEACCHWFHTKCIKQGENEKFICKKCQYK